MKQWKNRAEQRALLLSKSLHNFHFVEFGWSSNILKIQIENDLFKHQIEKQKVKNFTATLIKVQSDFENNQIFDRNGNSVAFVARQKHFQVGDSDCYTDLIL